MTSSYNPGVYEIGIDVDEVLSDCHGRLVALASQVCGRELDPCATPPNLEEAIGADAADAVWRIVDATPGWNVAPFPEAAEALARLRVIGAVVAVTSPHTSGTWMNDRSAWLKSIGFVKNDIIQTSGKFRIPVHVLIDDLTSNLVKWKRRNPLGLAIRWPAYHNKHDAVPAGIVEAENWDTAIQEIWRHKRAWAATQQGYRRGTASL